MPSEMRQRNLSREIIYFIKENDRGDFTGSDFFATFNEVINANQDVKESIADIDVGKVLLEELNDCTDSECVSIFPGTQLPCVESDVDTDCKFQYTTEDLTDNIKKDPGNVREIIEVVESVSDQKLITILLDVWKSLGTTEGKQKFIVAISANKVSANTFCQYVLLPEMKDEQTFYQTLEIISPMATWIHKSFIDNVMIPLFHNADSILVKEIIWIKDFVDSLSNSQKFDLLCSFITSLEAKFEKYHLQILNILFDMISIDERLFEILLNLLSVNMETYNKERYMGKLLLQIVKAVSQETSGNMLNLLSNLCSNFRGVMRFRILSDLKKISN